MGPRCEPVTGLVAVIASPARPPAARPPSALCSHLPGAVHLQQDAYFRDPDDCPPDVYFCDHRWLHLDAFLDAFRALATGGRASVARAWTSPPSAHADTAASAPPGT
jgi:hypothetical protein